MLGRNGFDRRSFAKQRWDVHCYASSLLGMRKMEQGSELEKTNPQQNVFHTPSSHKSWRKDKVFTRPASNKQCLSSTLTKHVLERQSNKKVASVWSRGPSSARQQGSPNRTNELESGYRNVKNTTLWLQQNALRNMNSFASSKTIRWERKMYETRLLELGFETMPFVLKRLFLQIENTRFVKEAWRNKDHKLKRVEKTEFARCAKKEFEKETLRGLELRPDL